MKAGCSEATSAYYAQTIEAQQMANRVKKMVEYQFGKEEVAIIGSAAGIIFVKQGNIMIDKNVNVIVGQTQNLLQLHWEY